MTFFYGHKHAKIMIESFFREAIRTSAAMPTAADIIVSHYQIHHHHHHNQKKIKNYPIIAFLKRNLDIFCC